MDFVAVVDQAIALLRQRGRLTYRTLQLQFQFDAEHLEALKEELIEGQRLAVDEADRILVWIGDAGTPAPASTPSAATQERALLTYTPPYLAEKILTSRSALEGERKQITVLFADLKGSTELIRDLDPEQAQAILDPALHAMMDAVHRYEGTVNQVLGDGIMALFGAPMAHEDHAVRACYAALAMQDAMRHYRAEVRRTDGLDVQIRVGLNSGEVVVRAIGNDLHMDYSAIGQTTHLAARMEQLTAATLRLVEGLVRVQALGSVPVKGLAAPVEVFALAGASAIRQRLQASAARGLTRFVGRQPELAALQQTLERAGAGQGQVIAVVGEAGVGKSRLVYEFVHSHHTQGWLVLESAAVSYGTATPYGPVIDVLRRYAHLDAADDLRTIRAKVTGQVVTLDETLQDVIPALLALLDALPEDNPFVTLDPPQWRQRTLDALKRVVLRASQPQRLRLVCEDLHWMDSETQALLGSLVESLPTAPLLLLVTYRPEYQPRWGSTTSSTHLRLDPLPLVSADAFLHALLGDDPSLAPLKHLLTARTEGNPFFLEESVRTLVETGVLGGEPGAWRLATPLDSLQVPGTIQVVLAARIDRLPAAEKRLLQMAAVIGTEVPLPLLQAIAALPEAALHRGLAHLQTVAFLSETRLFPERAYTFQHVLTHEVAYGSLLQERRRALHGQIVAALETLVGDRRGEQVEHLAQHAVQGQVWHKALQYCQQAGAKAVARAAYRAAVGYWEQALEALAHLPPDRPTLEQAIDLRWDLYEALLPLGQHAQRLTHLRAAETVAAGLGDHRRLGRVSRGLANVLRNMQEYAQALAYCQRTHAIATALGDRALEGGSNFERGWIFLNLGEYRQAKECLQQLLPVCQGEPHDQTFDRVGHLAVRTRTLLVTCLGELGAFAAGVAYGAEALQIAEAVDHPFERLIASLPVGQFHIRQGTMHQAIPLLERAVALSQDLDLPTWYRSSAASLALAYALAGRTTDALTSVGQVMGNRSGHHLACGEAYLRAGDVEEAHRLAERALVHTRERNMRGQEAWALWLLGEIVMRRRPLDAAPAAAHYEQSLALATELGMRPLQAHCHYGLSTLYTRTGQHEQARTALPTAIGLYRAMEMTFWLPEAETALAQVERR